MIQSLGDFPVNGKVGFLWNTNDLGGASITRATDGTLKIFKMNATAATWATERSSLNGVTQLEDFDSTGIHSVYIDLSDNSDAGFYAAGNEYQVAIIGTVIDGKTVNAVLANFSIERSGGILSILKGISAAVATDAGNSSTTFKTTLSSAVNDFYKDLLLIITSGTLLGQVKKVTGYVGATKIITVDGGFTGTPADNVTFDLVNR